MAHSILATTTASISELKKNPMATVAAGEGFPVAILNRNEPTFYCVPARAYEALIDAHLGADGGLTRLLRIGTLIQLLTRGDEIDADAVARRLGIEKAA